MERGKVLDEAKLIINGERQNIYGDPEDSFKLIAEYWSSYLAHRRLPFNTIDKEDVAMMMVLFKIAREANQHKRDNIVDAVGYFGIYGDMYDKESRKEMGVVQQSGYKGIGYPPLETISD